MENLSSIQPELKKVEEIIDRFFLSTISQKNKLAGLNLKKSDRLLLPALVLAVSNTAGPIMKPMITLGALFQCLYLANRIQGLAAKESGKDQQFSVIMGDYIFGQAIYLMSDEKIHPYLNDFVSVIKSINEGTVLRWRLRQKRADLKDYKLLISKERASLTALASRMSAEISGINPEHAPKLERLGYNLGFAWAAMEEPKFSFGPEYSLKVKANISELGADLSVKPLEDLYRFFQAEVEGNKMN